MNGRIPVSIAKIAALRKKPFFIESPLNPLNCVDCFIAARARIRLLCLACRVPSVFSVGCVKSIR